MSGFARLVLRTCREQRSDYYTCHPIHRRGWVLGYPEHRSVRRRDLVALVCGLNRPTVPYVTAPSVRTFQASLSRITPTKAERQWLADRRAAVLAAGGAS